MLLLPHGKDLPLELRRESFARIRAALLDSINSNLELDVLPIATVLEHFSDFDNIFGYGLGLRELITDAEQYNAGRELQFLVINDFVVQSYKEQHSPIGMRAKLYESDPNNKDNFRVVFNSRSDSQVQGFVEHSELLALLVGYRLMRDLLAQRDTSVSQEVEGRLSEAFSDGFHTAWQNLITRPRLPEQLIKVLDGTEPCRTFRCLDHLDQGLSDALAKLTKSVDNSVAQNTQQAVIQADGAVQ